MQWRSCFFTVLACLSLAACGGGGGSEETESTPNIPPPPIFGGLPKADLDEAALFLSQAGFGGNPQEIQALATVDFEQWLDAQFAIPPTLHAAPTQQRYEEFCASIGRSSIIWECETPDIVIWQLEFARFTLWKTLLQAPDQLKQKIAYALSQIMVVSSVPDNLALYPAVTHWWDVLLEHGTGNYRDLLRAVTLSPAMGVYLSHYLNSKGDPTQGIFPDENYAREVMQLFSIGLYELNPDGTRRKDGTGNDIPTYSNVEIRAFARIFTGLGNGCGDQQVFAPYTFPAFECPMRMYEDHHATGPKILLNGHIVPDGLTGMEDIEQAIDNLFNHPNVGPFIGRLLIQRLVMSNPSPGYIARVSAAFADNGEGMRGDMQAVIRAILLDPEARARSAGDPNYGKIRDPFLRFAHLYRALDLGSSTGDYPVHSWTLEARLKQFPLRSPSVFNFYSPNHVPFGAAGDAGLYAPEMQIANSASIPDYYNYLQAVVMWNWIADQYEQLPAELTLSYEPVEALLNHPQTLADYLDTLFTHGTMTEATREGIAAVAAESRSDVPADVARAAVVITMSSPEYVTRQ